MQWKRRMNPDALNYPVDYAIGTWVIGIQADSQTQVVSD